MSGQHIYVTKGSFGRAWAVQILDETGSPVDLTGATSVTFSMAPRGGGAHKIDAAAAVVGNGTYTLPDGSSQAFTPADGVVIYQPIAADVDTDGNFQGLISYVLGAGAVIEPGRGYVQIHIQPTL